jgi:pimeloyl-ACP methyl ester carboxylesterase
MYPGFILAGTLVFFAAGCNRAAMPVRNDTLTMDAVDMSEADLAGLGPQQVVSTRVTVSHQGENLTVALFRPAYSPAPAPAIVFLPGRMAPDDQYESYARALASRGFIVAVRGWYSIFTSDIELARDASVIASWLVRTQGVDSRKLGVAGHSMGGKDAVLAAAQYGVFASVVAIDPDDNGKVSVVHGLLTWLRVPLLLIGAEVAWQASSVCAPKATNYQRFFEQAPPGTVELMLRDADHVQVMDEPDRFGYGICRCGTADSRQVRNTARRATVGFFVQHLQGGAVLLKPPSSEAVIRVAQSNYVMEK